MKPTLLLLVLLLSYGFLHAQEISSVTDPRDGKTYKVIEFTIPLEGGVKVKRAWMLENMKYVIEGDSSICYDDEPAYCEKFGRLYTSQGAAAACPDGWRLPTRKDWFMLFSVFGGYTQAGKALAEGGSSGMNFLFGGYGTEYGYYTRVGAEGNYWDSAEKGGVADGVVTISSDKTEAVLGAVGKKYLNSCRCMKSN
ncbi:MAG: hypothetical protein OEY56_13725 [Cyclobacteriaceae bacterium]|nr:hypothetical protein [Cyclobacteriaceae bacterium]